MLAGSLLSVLAFASTAFALPAPQPKARAVSYSLGFHNTGLCVIDQFDRTFPSEYRPRGDNTPQRCIEHCVGLQQGYTIAAVG